jgi:hypothetical protein
LWRSNRLRRDKRHRRYLWSVSFTKTIKDEKRNDAQYKDHHRNKRRNFAPALPRFPFRFGRLSFTCRCLELRFVNNHERRFIEVATCVGIRINEEALGATFHKSGFESPFKT